MVCGRRLGRSSERRLAAQRFWSPDRAQTAADGATLLSFVCEIPRHSRAKACSRGAQTYSGGESSSDRRERERERQIDGRSRSTQIEIHKSEAHNPLRQDTKSDGSLRSRRRRVSEDVKKVGFFLALVSKTRDKKTNLVPLRRVLRVQRVARELRRDRADVGEPDGGRPRHGPGRRQRSRRGRVPSRQSRARYALARDNAALLRGFPLERPIHTRPADL